MLLSRHLDRVDHHLLKQNLSPTRAEAEALSQAIQGPHSQVEVLRRRRLRGTPVIRTVLILVRKPRRLLNRPRVAGRLLPAADLVITLEAVAAEAVAEAVNSPAAARRLEAAAAGSLAAA